MDAGGGHLSAKAQSTQLSVCKKVERYEGDLDEHFQRAGMRTLIGLLTYTTSDCLAGTPPRHAVPISGDIYKGTAFMHSCVSRYREFCGAPVPAAGDLLASAVGTGITQTVASGQQVSVLALAAVGWPVWPLPGDEA